MNRSEPARHEAIPAAPDEPPEYRVDVLQPLLRYALAVHGEAAFESVLRAAGHTPSTFRARRWLSQRECEAILEAAKDLAGDEATLRAACGYRFAEETTAMRYLLHGASPLGLYLQSNYAGSLLARGCKFECRALGRWHVRLRYTCPRKESRLLCVSRAGQFVLVPTLCGFPAATMTELRCIAWGDAACEYELRWREWPTARPIVLGVLLGAFAQGLLALAGLTPAGVGHLTLPAAGLVAGALALGRASRTAWEAGRASDGALDEFLREQQAAHSALLAYNERQEAWSRRLEERAGERADAVRSLAARMSELERERARALEVRGLSHDLRNPLTVVRLGVERLREGDVPEPERAALAEIDRAAAEMDALLGQLVASAADGADLVRVVPKHLALAPLVERVDRQLRALLRGRPVASSVVADALPPTIEADPLVVDRVVDNLLHNAVKYTPRGSIRVSVRSQGEWIALEVLDTGDGIAPERVLAVLRPAAARAEPEASRGGYGIGLSVVVKLLDAVGGRLEVASEPRVGSRFTALIPVRAREPGGEGHDRAGDAVDRVVTVLPWEHEG